MLGSLRRIVRQPKLLPHFRRRRSRLLNLLPLS